MSAKQPVSLKQIRNSMLWAAWGDAVGFPAELVSDREYSKRVGAKGWGGTPAWKKVVGGRFGVQVQLPAGAYSDDTQLRLATCRAIFTGGRFDVELFSKIELPIWLSYALGAGRGSKAAASSLTSNNVAWFSNFYSAKGIDYMYGGGNGAAMRIQPHVWSCADLSSPIAYMVDVVRNSVCTHGHVRGIIGAAIHARFLAYALMTRKIPPLNLWSELAHDAAESAVGAIDQDEQLSQIWLPTWEAKSGVAFCEAVEEVLREWEQLVLLAGDIRAETEDYRAAYRRLVDSCGGLDSSSRGSGILSALLSAAGSLWLDQAGERGALVEMGTLLGSDTDTIASMAGALIGACSSIEPPEVIQDREYLIQCADRLWRLSQSLAVDDFIYPDLLYWQPPKNALDVMSIKTKMIVVPGLGRVSPKDGKWVLRKGGVAFQWFEIWFGQTILCKYRIGAEDPAQRSHESVLIENTLPDLFVDKVDVGSVEAQIDNNIDALVSSVLDSNFNPGILGGILSEMIRSGRPVEDIVCFSALVTRSFRSR
ncbi:ADP-ribosylglycohydrolase family protein [Stenotrophomonas sp. 22692]|uniref:ADP-ribosylglycohydrolase family protein n=1 Tax=Stenotrophomonas sepilia TaxID=2860290 RepID=A0ABQ6QCR0_9GAMM|nr:ADP-ribosylglycohydrolase family protein [Stenotrophomonas maltophilia]MCU1037450.1 ADP-ribosylglycohydrolase family protein [Stenotrophomonas maltophilia]GMR27992.1 ADP-ribosylglycohydrolase family protein [Stenotrophomonas sepilia]